MFPMMTQEAVRSMLDLIRNENVSKRARRRDGFLSVYLKEGKEGLKKPYPGKTHSYLTEREFFIERHLAQFVEKPTLRRYLALVAWAYKPSFRMDEL